MRLDHISYATSHEQLSNTVQRIGSRLGGTFLDGGIHPSFGTRNFIMPLKNDQYLEVVCPLDHPSADSSPFGKMVSSRANEGGGWLTWVISTDNLSQIERRLERKAVDGYRRRPDGTNLKWKQIGVLDSLSNPQLPFFIKWETENHPSKDFTSASKIAEIEISGSQELIRNWISTEPTNLAKDVKFTWQNPHYFSNQSGLISVIFETPTGNVTLD